MHMRYLVFLLVLAAAAGLSGCGYAPQTISSLPHASGAPDDERLIGFWQMNVRADFGEHGAVHSAFYIQVWRPEEGNLSVLGIWASADTSNDPEWVKAHAHASSVDGQSYYNLRLVSGNTVYYCTLIDCRDEVLLADFQTGEFKAEVDTEREERTDKPESRFVILRAEISDQDQLFLYFMNPYVVRDLASKGHVRGRSFGGCDGFCGYDVLDLSQDELVNLLRTVGAAKLFFSKGVGPFYRVGAEVKWVDAQKLREVWDYFR